MNEMMNELIN